MCSENATLCDARGQSEKSLGCSFDSLGSGVLVTDVGDGVVGQLGQDLVESLVHLLGRSLEEATAARYE